MNYHFSKITSLGYEQALARAQEELKKEGFGIITEIDVRETLKKKINVDFRPYKILGACNPTFAHQALLTEKNIGVMLPCNVTVQQLDDGRVEVSAINPMENMKTVGNPALEAIGVDVAARLEAIIKRM